MPFRLLGHIGHIGIVEKRMEATIILGGYRSLYRVNGKYNGNYNVKNWHCIGIMENKIETTMKGLGFRV